MTRPSALGRRGFLHGLGGVAVVVGLGAAAGRASSAPALLRPPGGQEEGRFAALCLRCNKCVDVCPTRVVDLATLESGLLAARTPTLNFHLGYCTFCGKCEEACPTSALHRFDAETVRVGLARIDNESCIAWQWGGCTKCLGACRYQAIGLDPLNRPVVDAARCNGCGQCEFVCPAAQMRSYRSGQSRAIAVAVREEPR